MIYIVIYDILGLVKATRITYKKLSFILDSGDEIFVIVDVFKIPPPDDVKFPDGFKFSFCAFKKDDPDDRILMDCHPPKKPHFHEGNKESEFEWTGLADATDLFWEKVEHKFGKIHNKKGG